MEPTFAGKVCIVTGGTQGVGEATARMMSARGAAGIVICGRNADRGDAVAAEIAATGTDCRFVAADLASVDEAFKVVDTAAECFGRVDCLANVAGLTDRGTIETTDQGTYDRLFAVNTRAPFFLIQRVVPFMRKAGGGTVVNVISIAAHGGAPMIAAYVASKSALIGLTRNLGFALSRDGIRVNGLNMGWTATPGEEHIQKTAHGRGEDWLDEIERERPFGRLLRPEEVARVICILGSAESALTTGAVWDFDQIVIGAYA